MGRVQTKQLVRTATKKSGDCAKSFMGSFKAKSLFEKIVKQKAEDAESRWVSETARHFSLR